MKLEIIKGSENYTCQVIKLPNKIPVKGLDNLVEVNYQGNSCLVSKDSDPDELYLFFPAESQISEDFLKVNNLYRHSDLNKDKAEKGFFEDNRRVKAIKFKGVISSGFVIPLTSLKPLLDIDKFKVGDEFNSINDNELCRKYIKPADRTKGAHLGNSPRVKDTIDSKFIPEHPDTSQLMKNIHKLNLSDNIAVTYKLHGTSARYHNTLVSRELSFVDKIARFFGVKIQEKEYKTVCASRRVVKSIGFKEQGNKQHYFQSDLWSQVGEEVFKDKLNQGEAIYCEIIGKTYSGEEIQGGYSYGFDKPEVYIYRISNINPQGIEVDLSYEQMKERAVQLGIKTCPELFYGRLDEFILNFSPQKDIIDEGLIGIYGIDCAENALTDVFYNNLLEKPSILDSKVVEEGFCIRKDTCNKPEIYKVKSKQFLLHEGKQLDKEVKDIEVEESIDA